MFNDFVFDYCNSDLSVILHMVKNNFHINLKDIDELDSVFPYHELSFKNNAELMCQLFLTCDNRYDINQKDEIGNTPLIIAAMKGNSDIIKLLVYLNADVNIKNSDGWTAIDEAKSFGNVEQVTILFKLEHLQNKEKFHNMKRNIIKTSPDFIIHCKWTIETWVPVLSRFLPNDDCVIYRSKNKIRYDTTIVNFQNMKWQRGNVSFIINSQLNNKSEASKSFIYMINHDKSTYSVFSGNKEKPNKDDDIALSMSTSIFQPSLNIDDLMYHKKKRFWSFVNKQVVEQIGDYQTKFYDLTGVKMFIRKRIEHISQEKRNDMKSVKKKMMQGNFKMMLNIKTDLKDLSPPEPNSYLWQDYRTAMLNKKHLVIGRKHDYRESIKHFKLTVGMSEEFPLSLEELVNVIKQLAPLERFTSVDKIISSKLPPGFPVYIEVPVYPTITAKISINRAKIGNPTMDMDENLFGIPESYTFIRNPNEQQQLNLNNIICDTCSSESSSCNDNCTNKSHTTHVNEL